MTDDKQIHTLPEAGPKLDALAVFLGYSDTQTFRAEMLGRPVPRWSDLWQTRWR